jgi:hypothetical protein
MRVFLLVGVLVVAGMTLTCDQMISNCLDQCSDERGSCENECDRKHPGSSEQEISRNVDCSEACWAKGDDCESDCRQNLGCGG